MPTPTANIVSSRVTTWPSAPSVSWATVGNSDEQRGADRPEPAQAEDRQPDRAVGGRLAGHGDRLAQDVPADAQGSVGRRRRGDAERGGQAEQRDAEAGPADDGRPGVQQHQRTARHGSGQDGEEGRGLDQAVARDEFVVAQMVRQDAVFQRPEHRRLHAEAEQDGQQAGHAAGEERVGGQAHQQDLRRLHHPDQPRFVEAVRELAGGRGQQGVGSDEQRPGQRGEAGAARTQLEDGQHDHRVLHQVVVERAAGLGQAQRAQAAGKQQSIHDMILGQSAISLVRSASPAV